MTKAVFRPYAVMGGGDFKLLDFNDLMDWEGQRDIGDLGDLALW